MTNFKIFEEIKPTALNSKLTIETPIDLHYPFAFYDKEKDRIIIGYEPIKISEIKEKYITFPMKYGGGLSYEKSQNCLRSEPYGSTYGNRFGLSSNKIDDTMLYVRTYEHIGEEMSLVIGGDLFHIESVKVIVEQVLRYGQCDGGYRIKFRVKKYRELVRIQKAYPQFIELCNDELCFEAIANELLSKLCISKPESPFVDSTKY